MTPFLAFTSPILLLTALSYFWIRLAVRASGWEDLADQYRWPAPFRGTQWSRQTIRFSFGLLIWRSIDIKANETGLLLKPLFPYAHVANPIRIPWEELKLSKNGTLRIAAYPKIKMWLAPGVVKRIKSVHTETRNP